MLALPHSVRRSLDWSFKKYAKTRRSQGPDIPGLEMFSELVDIVVSFAPNCLPQYASLHAGFELLADDLCPKDMVTELWVIKATDFCRLAAHHMFSLKGNKNPPASARLQSILHKIDSRDAAAPQTKESVEPTPSGTAPAHTTSAAT